MDDLISRQVAIDAVCREWCNCSHNECKHPFDPNIDDIYYCDGCETVYQTLANIPLAQPERKRGEWIDMVYVPSHTKYKCSNCGKTIYTNSEYIKEHLFCFHCGADMRGEE